MKVTPWEVEASSIKTNAKNDPLLVDENLKFISGNNTLNIYRVLSPYDKHINSLTTYYHLDRKSGDLIRRLLRMKYGTLDKATEALLKNLEAYRGSCYSSKIKEKWRVKCNLRKGNITLEYARVISLMLEKDIHASITIFNRLLQASEFFISGNKKLKSPIKLADLNNELAYLAGVVAGDGHIVNELNEMRIVDGHKNDLMKNYSLKFLKSINGIIRRNFHYNSCVEKPSANYFVCRYNCSLICRIMNYIYEIPSGNKSKKIKVPGIVKHTNKESLFWRGIFDADGSIRKRYKAIKLTTSSRRLYSDFLDFTKNRGIVVFTRKAGKIYSLHVAEESIPRFVRLIGSSHPRKQKNLIGYMKKGATYKIPKSIKPNKNLGEVINYLRPYKNSIYIRLTARREITNKNELTIRRCFIKEKLNHDLVKVKRQRKSGHYYICSKDLLKEINEHYDFVPPWLPFKKCEIVELTERWNHYE